MSDKTALGDRMKAYEHRCQYQIMPQLPIVARLDGRNFSRLTQNIQKPFDVRFQAVMLAVTIYLVRETGASVGYTQSDEISLAWWPKSMKDERFFGNKMSKLVSVIGSMASVWLNRELAVRMPELMQEFPVFDNRVFELPTAEEVVNYFIWREQDAARNSIQGAARSVFDHDTCMHKNTSELHDMLHQAGVNWSKYPTHFKRGVYARRQMVECARTFSEAEIAKLPAQHHAHKCPTVTYKRPDVVVADFPLLTAVKNGVGVLFRAERPFVIPEQPSRQEETTREADKQPGYLKRNS